ncbi:serine/threonine-protein kinase [Mycolicibacterium sp. Dal123E01]|uniref:serine/threonine-protein kinase n=1 Tax=Mycolicibacterium sp. Dal123E01 TaxID=3457578 RepID=UPI00403E3F87
MPLQVGELFAGYQVLGLLASDGVGQMYLVQHPRLPRREALTVLPPELSHDAAFRERFFREADLAAGLRHPNILAIHDRGENDGQLWIAMDHVDGTDAAHLVASRYPAGVPSDLVTRIVGAVAGALDYAHKQGLLHRDVKPGTIVVADIDSGDPKVFLANFGGLTSTKAPAYSAPEQLVGGPVDGRSDQYSLAATAYHLLTGLQPLPQSHPAAAPRLSDRRPDLAGMDPALQTALANNPNFRYPSCSAFAQGLGQSTQWASPAGPMTTPGAPVGNSFPGYPWPPPPPGFPEPMRERTGNTAQLLALIGCAVLVVCLIAAGGFAAMTYTRAEHHAAAPPAAQPAAQPAAAPAWSGYVDAGEKFAVYLTTISHATVDIDVDRILDNSTGSFHDDFARRAEAFKQTVRQAKSVSVGKVTAAGLEELESDRATVLVAITVNTTNTDAPQQEPRSWRMRLGIVHIDGGYKTEKTEFVS